MLVSPLICVTDSAPNSVEVNPLSWVAGSSMAKSMALRPCTMVEQCCCGDCVKWRVTKR